MKPNTSVTVALLAAVPIIGLRARAGAQAPISGLTAQADSRIQAEAAVLWRILAARPAYAETGEWMGQVANVTVGPNGASLVAIVTLQPRYGWGSDCCADFQPPPRSRADDNPGHAGFDPHDAAPAEQVRLGVESWTSFDRHCQGKLDSGPFEDRLGLVRAVKPAPPAHRCAA